MLHVERRGVGPRLLYCNGSGATLRDVRPLLNLLSRSFDLLAFDYRGMGDSPPVTEPYTMADIADDVTNLLDAAGWDRTALLGVSFGGMVAQEFAVTHPERVERLALLCTYHRVGRSPPFRSRLWRICPIREADTGCSYRPVGATTSSAA